MEKIVYLIKHDISRDKLLSFVSDELVPLLQTLDAQHINIGISDDAVSDASEKLFITTTPQYNIYLSFFLPSGLHLDGWLANDYAENLNALLQNTEACHRYVTTESMVLDPSSKVTDNSNTIQRIPGWMQLALLTKPEKMTRTEWLDTWLYSHTQLAVETQSTFGYVQNLVQRPLSNTDSLIDGLVTEHFPDKAMTSLDAFYAADDDANKREQHEQAMMQSCARFIDFSSINVIPMSAYIINSTN